MSFLKNIISYTTFYLKYRPQTLAELDLGEIREKLTSVLSSGKTPHAFLFTGPKGLGKTSAARIVAKAVNCQNRQSKKIEPCNKCKICKNIIKGVLLDLIEIDGASNRGIDDIRNLRERIKLSPNEAEKKVYIIDEVHMLTVEAFNALLKTLEEPPPHALFILCTTEVHKLPETIISRCMRLDFYKPSLKELIRPLKRIVRQEKIKVDDKAFLSIAKYADGSFRDGVKILEQLTYSKRKITEKEVVKFFGQSSLLADDFLKSLAEKNTKKTLSWLNSALGRGVDLKSLIQDLLLQLRNILLQKYGVISEEVADFGLDEEEVKKLIVLFDQAGREIKEAVLSQLPLELAIIKWGNLKKPMLAKPKQDFLNMPQKSKNKSSQKTPAEIKEKWDQFLKAIKPVNHSIEAFLKATRPLEISEGIIKIEVFYPFHKEKLEQKANIKIIEEKLTWAFKKPVKVRFILKK
ncbi:DNA polymerase III subunit gamma/tau [Patescibacteria group bacterium]